MVLLQWFWGSPGEETNPHFFHSFLDAPPDLIHSDWLLIKDNQETNLKLQSFVHLIPLLQHTLSCGRSSSSFSSKQGLRLWFAVCRSSHSLYTLPWICLMYGFRRGKGTVFPWRVEAVNCYIKRCLVSGSMTCTTLMRIAVQVSQCVHLLRVFTSLLLCGFIL